MQSKFEINTFRKKKLMEMLKTLFKEYNLIRIKRNGMVLFGSKFLCFPIIQQKVHISELCIDEIPTRMSTHRNGNVSSYLQKTKECLEHIIVSHSCNIIDYLYQEFSNIITSSKVDILLQDSQYNSKESNSDSITIKAILSSQVRGNNSNIKGVIKNLNRIGKECRFRDQFCEKVTLAA